MSDRRGAALPLVLLLLALLGCLAALTLLGARIRVLAGQRALDREHASASARGAAERALAGWNALLADTLPIGVGVRLALPPPSGIRAEDSVLRLGRSLYLIRSLSERIDAGGGVLARSGLGYLVHLVSPALPETAAVVAAGPVLLGSGTWVTGHDSLPTASWGAACPPLGPTGPGVLGTTAGPDCPGGGCAHGAPPILADTSITPGRLAMLGGVGVGHLIAQADRRVAGVVAWPGPVVAGGLCDRSAGVNWGDPLPLGGPCAAWFPVVAAAPGAVVGGGVGQGVLIGEGALELSGGAEFTGVVVSVGPLRVRDRARVTGAVVALDSVSLSDSVTVKWSYCATMMALSGVAKPALRPVRPWQLGP